MRAMFALCAGTLLVLLSWLTAQAEDDRDFGRAILLSENGWAASGAGITGVAAAISAQPLANPSAIDVADANQLRAMSHHPDFESVGFADTNWISTLDTQRLTPLAVPLLAGPKVW